MSKLDEIRAKLRAADRSRQGSFGSSDNTVFAHWNLPDTEGTNTASLRFLPDADEEETYFWAEKNVIKLPFRGIKGEEEDKKVIVQVPCIEMPVYGGTCPILQMVRPWFDDKEFEPLARKYWKKRSYLFQGFVQASNVLKPVDTPPDNLIRRFNLSPQLYKLVKAALLNPEMAYIPTDYMNGTDFTVVKTKDGEWADYGTSYWARRETALTDVQLAAIEEHGLLNLKDYLPKRPSEEGLAAMVEMFEASVDGELYDPEKWAAFYKPFGFDWKGETEEGNAGKASAEGFRKPEDKKVETPEAKEPVAEPVAKEPVVEPGTTVKPATDSSEKVSNLLAQLQARNKTTS